MDSDIFTFFSNDIGLSSINLTSVNLADDNFDHYYYKTINYVRPTAWYNRFKQRKAC